MSVSPSWRATSRGQIACGPCSRDAVIRIEARVVGSKEEVADARAGDPPPTSVSTTEPQGLCTFSCAYPRLARRFAHAQSGRTHTPSLSAERRQHAVDGSVGGERGAWRLFRRGGALSSSLTLARTQDAVVDVDFDRRRVRTGRLRRTAAASEGEMSGRCRTMPPEAAVGDEAHFLPRPLSVRRSGRAFHTWGLAFPWDLKHKAQRRRRLDLLAEDGLVSS